MHSGGAMAGKYRGIWVVFWLCVIVGLLLPGMVRAQETLIIQQLHISIWPEFDQRAALVFFTGEVAPDTPLPVVIDFTLPETSTLHAVAYVAEDGQFVNAAFSIERDRVSVTSPNGTFHIEFYDAALQFDGEARHYVFEWTPGYPVELLTWEVQQPAAASGLRLAPGESTLTVGDYGLSVYRSTWGSVEAGEAVALEVDYHRPTSALTVELLEQEAGTPPVTDRASVSPLLITAVIGGVILLGVGSYILACRLQGSRAEMEDEGEQDETAPDSVLTGRELEVLQLVAEGLVNREIGERLGISPKTVARHRENIMSKLGLHSRTELVKYAIQIGLIDLDKG
ncbi:MAG: hypothetical protein Kow00124_08890 [Anaerolineae bacterium]